MTEAEQPGSTPGFAPPIVRKASALLPLAMSAGAMGIVIGYLALHGPLRQPDEGAAAHVWQLLMAGQLPIIGYYALRWVPTAPKDGLKILLVQVAAWVAAAAPIFILDW
ncbi:MAG: hypothetical protein U9Q74_03440 [Gemmatimonadota bacterium]|nr:hypothetical protein [Gemmatimonadota bacterium]